ncbi:MAG TPA: MFS transporter [candidate division Zixibacteria bacterium]|nr:MFS transporter [candidate division Zixibacteria bacterium]
MSELNIQKESPEIESNLKGFAFFWSGQLFSILGSSAIQFVLTWWITIETESPLLLSLATLVGFFPTIILTPIAGVFVDRWNRKILIGTVDFLQAAVTVILLFLFKFNKVTIIILFVFLALRGVLQAFHQPAIQALIPIMVPKKHLSRTNSIQYFLSNIIFLIGPMIAALLFSFLEIHQILWLDAITFCIAVIPLILIKIPKLENDETQIKKSSFFTEFKEGIRFMKEKKGLFALLGSFAATNLFLMPFFILLNLFIYVNHSGSEIELSYVIAFNQAGSIAGTLLFIFWKGFRKKVNGVALGITIGLSGGLLVAFSPQGLFWFMGIGFLIIGFAISMANISSQTIWQTVVPKEMLGRVMSVRFAVAQFVSPLGMIISGLIAEVVNIQYVMIGSLSLGLLSFGVFFFFSSMRKVEEGIYSEKDIEEIKSEKAEVNLSKEVEVISPP